MSSPALNESVFAVDRVTETLSETHPEKTAERAADPALTARAVVAVTVLGAGFWYLLWKIALYFEAGR